MRSKQRAPCCAQLRRAPADTHLVDREADVVERGRRVRQQLASGVLQQLHQEAAHLKARLAALVHVGLAQSQTELRVLPVRLYHIHKPA